MNEEEEEAILCRLGQTNSIFLILGDFFFFFAGSKVVLTINNGDLCAGNGNLRSVAITFTCGETVVRICSWGLTCSFSLKTNFFLFFLDKGRTNLRFGKPLRVPVCLGFERCLQTVSTPRCRQRRHFCRISPLHHVRH